MPPSLAAAPWGRQLDSLPPCDSPAPPITSTVGCPYVAPSLLQPDPATLEREVSAYRSAAASTSAPRFEVHRLVMADSGTLLLCSVDHSGHLAALRRRLRAAFPGGPPKQSTIVHASIARLLTPEQLTTEQITRVQVGMPRMWVAGGPCGSYAAAAELGGVGAAPIVPVQGGWRSLLGPNRCSTAAFPDLQPQAVCDAWSERLRGQRFNPERIYHIQARALGCVRLQAFCWDVRHALTCIGSRSRSGAGQTIACGQVRTWWAGALLLLPCSCQFSALPPLCERRSTHLRLLRGRASGCPSRGAPDTAAAVRSGPPVVSPQRAPICTTA